MFEESNFVHAEKKPTEVVKVKPPSFFPCEMCGKPTKSHRFYDKTYLCHGCYEDMTDEELAAYRENHKDPRWNDDADKV